MNIFCIGRNYIEHAHELGHAAPEEPVVFLKPSGAFVENPKVLRLATEGGRLDPEVEIVLFIGQDTDHLEIGNALAVVQGYGVGLDCTLRDEQSRAKAKGLPWVSCKGRRNFAPVSESLSVSQVRDQELEFFLEINGVRRQSGRSEEMVFSIPKILVYLSSRFGLRKGDIVFTGTPAGVGPVAHGDKVHAELRAGSAAVCLEVRVEIQN